MKLLVIGDGGREHALVWKLSQSVSINKIYAAPGNCGTYNEKKTENIEIAQTDIISLMNFAKKHMIDLTIVGSELPLSLGIVDLFNYHGLKCLGPTQYCAQLESSKVFSKQFMYKHNIPTASYQKFLRIEDAKKYTNCMVFPSVIKADGLASGKGVVIVYSKQEAIKTIIFMFEKYVAKSIMSIIIEEFLEGEEASFIVLCDGKYAIPMASSKDHKTIYENNKGPNTGGMGAYSPSKLVSNSIHSFIMSSIIEPVLCGMRMLRCYYKGFLYVGLMILPNNSLKVLEFNCRFGDPETQPVLLRFNSDFALLCLAAVKGQLNNHYVCWNDRVALGVVMSSRGYPNYYSIGQTIKGLNLDDNGLTTKIFHAGTKQYGSDVLVNGGRVLCVTVLEVNILAARKLAYALIKKITWSNEYYRTDIGLL